MFSNTNVQTWDELVALIEENPGKEVSISFLRNGNMIESDTTLESRTINTQQVGYLGVTPTIENEKIGLITAFKSTTILELQMTIAAVDGIITLFSPENIKTLLGTYSGQTIPDEVRPLSPI